MTMRCSPTDIEVMLPVRTNLFLQRAMIVIDDLALTKDCPTIVDVCRRELLFPQRTVFSFRVMSIGHVCLRGLGGSCTFTLKVVTL